MNCDQIVAHVQPRKSIISAVAALLLILLNSSGCALTVKDVIRRYSEPNQHAKRDVTLIHITGGNDSVEMSNDDNINEIIRNHYTYCRVNISYEYDEDKLERAWEDRFSYVDFEKYLRIKDAPFTDRDLEIVALFELKKTPAYIVAQRDGTILGTFEISDQDRKKLRVFRSKITQFLLGFIVIKPE